MEFENVNGRDPVRDVFSRDRNRIHQFIICYHKENLSPNIRNKYWIRFSDHFDDTGTTQITWLIKMHWKWEKCGLFPCHRTFRITNLPMERIMLQWDNHWTQDPVLTSAVVSSCGLVLGPLRWTLSQQPEKHSYWIYFLYFFRFWGRVQRKPWAGFDLNLAIKFMSFSQIIFSDVGALCILFGWQWRSEKIHFFFGKCGIPSSNVDVNCVPCGWHWRPDYFHQFDANGPWHLPILCAICGEHRHSAYFHTPGSTSGNSPIYCEKRTLRRAWLFRRRVIFRSTHRCRWLFPNFGVQSYSARPPNTSNLGDIG
jgi:hypothetical protein